jgi:lipoprotein-anchoring transpeptidase ErfK/SrfK
MPKPVEQRDRVVIRFAGDSGDGMQLTGGRFASETANVPVRPASHGCVRVTRYDARWLFRQIPVGTPVTVLRR